MSAHCHKCTHRGGECSLTVPSVLRPTCLPLSTVFLLYFTHTVTFVTLRIFSIEATLNVWFFDMLRCLLFPDCAAPQCNFLCRQEQRLLPRTSACQSMQIVGLPCAQFLNVHGTFVSSSAHSVFFYQHTASDLMAYLAQSFFA